jgi:N-acetylneuraminic acid mutarotase
VANPRLVLLKDGRVLITGGYVYKSAVSTVRVYQKKAWLYAPTKDAFVAAGEMATERDSHSANLLPDGRVLVVGGRNASGELDSTEIFDPTQPAASAWQAGPSLAAKRSGHTAVTLGDGRILYAAGGNWSGGANYLDSVMIYKPASANFVLPAVTLSKGRMHLTGALLPSGKVLLAGGDDGSSAYSNLLELFDPATSQVTKLSVTMTDKKVRPFAFTLPGGKVLITAGYAFAYPPSDDLYDPLTNKITKLNHPGGSARGSEATLLANGRVLVLGGYEKAQEKKARAFDGKTLSWEMLPDMLQARSYLGVITLMDGSVLAVGGRGGAGNTFPTQAERLFNP